MKIKGLLVIIGFSVFFRALGQENTPDIKDTINLGDVVITGSMIRVNRNNIPMAVSVVSREQIAESTESALLPVLNGRVPGLFVTERGITGFGVAQNAAGQITMRGIGGNPTTGILMLIDGHPQFMGLFGHPLSDSYVSSDVERVEVIRGPASILYGSNAMGGVINIITRQQTDDGLHGNARLMYGSYGTLKYSAAGGYRKNRFSVYASANHDQTNGHRPYSDFKITNGYIKLGYDISKSLAINTDFSLADFTTTDPGPDTVNAVPGDKLHIKRGYWSFSLDNEYEKFSGSLKLYDNFGEHNISNAYNLPVENGFHSKDYNYGLNLYESAKLFKGNTITVGLDYALYGGKAENLAPGIVFLDTTVRETGVFAFIQQSLFNRLTINGGLRLQHHSVYGDIWIPSGGSAFNITPVTTWKVSVSKGFRSPTIQELFLWNHNPSLNPEHIMNYETGILHSFMKNKIRLELTWFLLKGDNMIINVPFKGLENAGSVNNQGIEFAGSGKISHDLFFNVTYSFIGMKDPVFATPKHHFYTGFRYNIRNFRLMANLEYINHLDTDPTPAVAFQNYTLINVKASYQPCKYFEMFISGENLLNTKYETLRYYTMPRFTAFGGINVNF
jgi:outer membrane cobalamin receptor